MGKSVALKTMRYTPNQLYKAVKSGAVHPIVIVEDTFRDSTNQLLAELKEPPCNKPFPWCEHKTHIQMRDLLARVIQDELRYVTVPNSHFWKMADLITKCVFG